MRKDFVFLGWFLSFQFPALLPTLLTFQKNYMPSIAWNRNARLCKRLLDLSANVFILFWYCSNNVTKKAIFVNNSLFRPFWERQKRQFPSINAMRTQFWAVWRIRWRLQSCCNIDHRSRQTIHFKRFYVIAYFRLCQLASRNLKCQSINS